MTAPSPLSALSRTELLERCRTLAGARDAAVIEAADAVRERDLAVGQAERLAARVAETDDLADMLAVLARWNADLAEAPPAVVLETALRDAVRWGLVAARRDTTTGWAA